jgi:hypothetical protein
LTVFSRIITIGGIIGAAIQQNQQRSYQQQHPQQMPMPPQMPQNGYSSSAASPWAKDDPLPRSSTPHDASPRDYIPRQRDASNLPMCDAENALAALKYAVLGNVGSGLNEMSEFLTVDHVMALGINNNDSSKMCRVTFRCDLDAAKAKEANYNGPHKLSAVCYQWNQQADGGNPVWLRFSIKPDGDGGTLITTFND